MIPGPVVAYFSMEIGMDPSIPTYAGGLGVLAGDTIRSAADLEIPMVGVTLLHRQGYFRQLLDRRGRQSEEPVIWKPEEFLEPLDARASVEIEGRTVHLRAWRYPVTGVADVGVPIFLLDTDLPENSPDDRRFTDTLYGGDARYRLCQETILGLGGVRMLRALGYEQVLRFHLNEGHAALIILALIEERLGSREPHTPVSPGLLDAVRDECVFTTHTPVPAGHDQFPGDLVQRVLGDPRSDRLRSLTGEWVLNLTDLALRGSRFVNGVAMTHGEISRDMFPHYPVHSITNGVHIRTWAADSFQALYDRYLPEWKRDGLSLRYAIGIPAEDIWAAHVEAKRLLLDHVNDRTDTRFREDVLTIGFARRATAYKRAGLIFMKRDRLKKIVKSAGPVQLVFAGKAHPRDQEGKEIIQFLHQARDELGKDIPIAYLPNHDMTLAKLMCAGSDVWLNTPLPPLEASGTSGMKAAMNGVPSLSVLDGWWAEGHVEGVTGWAIGDRNGSTGKPEERGDEATAEALYDKLETAVIPCFYRNRDRFMEMMRSTIALNGSFFNTERMLWQYLHRAYRIHRRNRTSSTFTP
jgi:starch phosphorylase